MVEKNGSEVVNCSHQEPVQESTQPAVSSSTRKIISCVLFLPLEAAYTSL